MAFDDPHWSWSLIEKHSIGHVAQAIADERWDDALKSVNNLTGSLHTLRAQLKRTIARAEH